ncbi:MAG: toll/interleukin-1 receptor domain-containing protein [Nitrospirota bacterium]
MTTKRELREKVETLQNLLVAHATGSPAKEKEFHELREELLSDELLRDLLPGFLRTVRDLPQFQAFIRKDRPRYSERREFIWTSFSKVLDFLESREDFSTAIMDSSAGVHSAPPQALPENKTIRAFISYSTKDKEYGAQVKRILEAYGIECFLAHEDLEVSEEWKNRILEELERCDLFIALLSKAFRESDWAPQEVGVIAGRKGIAIIPLSVDGVMPFGFISQVQGKRIPTDGVSESVLISPLIKKYPHTIIPGMIQKVASAGSYRRAEAVMKPLVPLFPILNDDEINALVTASIGNDEVWSASLCRMDYLPKLIQMHRNRIKEEALKALEYQIENNEWYRSEA